MHTFHYTDRLAPQAAWMQAKRGSIQDARKNYKSTAKDMGPLRGKAD
jgi:hypothetical protein